MFVRKYNIRPVRSTNKIYEMSWEQKKKYNFLPSHNLSKSDHISKSWQKEQFTV